MKKSTAVPATMIVALAAGIVIVGCGQGRDCVDAQGRIVPDVNCRSGSAGGARWVPRSNVDSGGFGGSGSAAS